MYAAVCLTITFHSSCQKQEEESRIPFYSLLPNKPFVSKKKKKKKKVGLKLNVQKTKIVESGAIMPLQIDQETMETVMDFISLS